MAYMECLGRVVETHVHSHGRSDDLRWELPSAPKRLRSAPELPSKSPAWSIVICFFDWGRPAWPSASHRASSDFGWLPKCWLPRQVAGPFLRSHLPNLSAHSTAGCPFDRALRSATPSEPGAQKCHSEPLSVERRRFHDRRRGPGNRLKTRSESPGGRKSGPNSPDQRTYGNS